VTDRPEFVHRRERRGLIGPFGGRQLLGGAVVVVVVAIVLVVATTPLGSTGGINLGNPQPTQYVITPGVTNGLRVGDVPPALSIPGADGSPTPLLDLAGRPIDLTALRGHPIWINFFASWCPPCQSETPVVRDIAERYRDHGLVVLGISVQESSVDNVRAYADRYQLGYTIGADSRGAIYNAYRLRGIPTSFFVGTEGAIHAIMNGPLTEAGASRQVEALLPAAAASTAPSASSGPGASAR
jgi:thiol-disulfide isomerase/thioredoxin